MEGGLRTLPPSAARLLRDFDDVAGSKNLREQLQAMKSVRKFGSEMRGGGRGGHELRHAGRHRNCSGDERVQSAALGHSLEISGGELGGRLGGDWRGVRVKRGMSIACVLV
jgi:hypothetical protein